jgi:hypothetical protein
MQKDLHWVGIFADLVGIGAQESLEIVVVGLFIHKTFFLIPQIPKKIWSNEEI